MADDMQLNLLNHQLQLQQVEAALELDKENEELIKLRDDLKEVIRLAIELVGKAPSDESRWKVGDHCTAMCSRDKLYYRATILEFLNDSSCVVNFTEYETTDVAHLKQVSKLTAPPLKRKKDEKARSIEKKKNKKIKLLQRHEEIERACEQEKNQWLNFSKKMLKHGKTKKSIFATPETSYGRVGVGTCGIAGKPMTKFQASQALRK